MTIKCNAYYADWHVLKYTSMEKVILDTYIIYSIFDEGQFMQIITSINTKSKKWNETK